MVLVACGATFPSSTGPSGTTSARLLFSASGTDWPIAVGNGASLNVYTVDSDGGWTVPRSVNCASSNVSVASVPSVSSSSCSTFGLAGGAATLNASVGGQAASVDLAFVQRTYPALKIVWAGSFPQAGTLPMQGRLEARIVDASNAVGQDVTSSATWSTSDPAVATMSGNAFTGHTPGNVIITVNAQGRTASIRIGVQPRYR